LVKFTFETDEKEITLVSIKIDYRNNSAGVGLLQKATELLENIKASGNSTTIPNIVVESSQDKKSSSNNSNDNLKPPPEMLRSF
jgi:hypothetical protein